MAQTVKCLPTTRETWIQSLGWEDLLEKEMTTHSRILAWNIPWMEEPGRLQSMGSQRVGHDWATSLLFSPFFCYRSNFYKTASWQLIQIFREQLFMVLRVCPSLVSWIQAPSERIILVSFWRSYCPSSGHFPWTTVTLSEQVTSSTLFSNPVCKDN